MGQVVVWGNGDTVTGRFKVPAGKTAVSAEAIPQSGGIRVDWGGGDVVTLPGQTWSFDREIQTKIVANYSPGTCPSWFRRPSGGAGNCCLTISRSGVSLSSSVFRNSPPHPVIFATGFEESACTPQIPGSNNRYYVSGSSTQGPFSYLFTWSGTSCNPVFNLVSLTETVANSTVTTNTGQSSSRAGDKTPTVSLLTAGCFLTITYTDGSQAINLSDCPGFIRVEDDSQCPPGSCTCDHPRFRCCIGSNGQVIKKIRL